MIVFAILVLIISGLTTMAVSEVLPGRPRLILKLLALLQIAGALGLEYQMGWLG